MKLVRFLMNFSNYTSQPVTLELKNGSSINGQILSCSPSMNISMKNVKLIRPHQDPQLLQYMNIRGNQIRLVILPDDLNIDSVLAKSAVTIKGQGAGPGSQNTNGIGSKGALGRNKGAPRGGARARPRAM
ncbi:Piso0_005764 [Millerozyma farinosa CBS 7064]|uniref:Piso0_005764 protein n=1 Tax=Pichia sorbitophila (strain ATCC MYA-4447 / BCRC 22081 / CBS 7064 / NBRC 10061 / NRRL Y-12695) TaxID=559304 RepID=G8Y2V3_PICSO|nr:Piso0_005764 [Millerozyma farinosa CBS 7064]